jgi:molybdate transport system regulatory protein
MVSFKQIDLLYLGNQKNSMKKKEIRFRCWIDIDGAKFFGPGPAELLQLIGKTGSISKAAKSMGMSYKKAWDMVDHLNSKGQKLYVISHKGGQKGGGAELTSTGKQVVAAYGNLVRKIQTVVIKDKHLLKLI